MVTVEEPKQPLRLQTQVTDNPELRQFGFQLFDLSVRADLNRTKPVFSQARSEIARRMQADRQVHHLDAKG